MTTQGRRWSWLRDLNYWRWELYSLIFTEAGFRNLNEIQLLSLSFPTLLKSIDRELCFEVCWVEMCLWEIPVRRADLVTGELHPSVCSFCSNHTAYSCRPLSLNPRVRNLSRLHLAFLPLCLLSSTYPYPTSPQLESAIVIGSVSGVSVLYLPTPNFWDILTFLSLEFILV